MQALKFECGICGCKIKRERKQENHNNGIFGYIPLNPEYVTVYGKSTTLSKKIQDFFGEKYPEDSRYNPNICKSCYNGVCKKSPLLKKKQIMDSSEYLL